MRNAPHFVAALLLSVAHRSAAQELRGVVRDSASQQPVSGAVVQLLDSVGTLLVRNITNDRGQYRLVLVGGAKRLRVVRLGFRPRLTLLPSLGDGFAPFDVAIMPIPTLLEAVSVRDDRRCPRRKDSEAALGLWAQARAGLLSTVVAREANPAMMRRLRFVRSMDGNSDRIESQTVYADSTDSRTASFHASHSAAEFVRRGFMDDSAGFRLFSSPDAEVLMDEAFADGYCFHLTGSQKSRPTQVGLAFQPGDRGRIRSDTTVKHRVDVEGTVWIDTSARALREIEFRYLGIDFIDRRAADYKLGGRVTFKEMTNGVVLIDFFHLRLLGQAVRAVVRGRQIIGLVATESGGTLARAEWPGGLTWKAPLGSVAIQALAAPGRPAAGTKVFLTDTHYSAVADSTGLIMFNELLAGPYAMQVADSRAAKLGLALPTMIRFVATNGAQKLAPFTIPTLDDDIVDRCKAADLFDVGDSTRVLGRVMTRGGDPVQGVELSYLVTDRLGVERKVGENWSTGSDGVFQLCNKRVRVGMILAIMAKRGNQPPVEALRVALTDKLTLARILVGDNK